MNTISAHNEDGPPRSRQSDKTDEQVTTRNGLKRAGLDWKHVAILSIAGCGPASVIALNVQFMGTFAKANLVLAFVFVWPGILLIANTFGEFAKRLPTSGGLYTWNVHAWGPNVGFVYGWTFIGSYLVFSAAGFAVLGGWLNEWIETVSGVNIPWWLFTLLGLFYIAVLAYLGIVESLKAMTIFLATEAALLVVLSLWIIFSGGGPQGLTMAPLTPGSGVGTVGLASIALAMTYAVLSHVGIEEGATLGQEMNAPQRNVAKGIWVTAILVPIFYIFVSYAMVIGFGVSNMGEKWANDPAPLQSIAQSYWGNAGLSIVSLSAAISILAFSQGCFLAGVRVLYTLGREGVLPRSFSRVSKRGTPSAAIIAMLVVSVGLGFPLAVVAGPFNVWGLFGFLISVAFTVSYIVTHAGLIKYMLRIGEFKIFRHGILGGVGALVFLYPLIRTVYPLTPGAYSVLPFIYVAWVLIGVGLLLYTRRRRPHVIGALGTSVAETE